MFTWTKKRSSFSGCKNDRLKISNAYIFYHGPFLVLLFTSKIKGKDDVYGWESLVSWFNGNKSNKQSGIEFLVYLA